MIAHNLYSSSIRSPHNRSGAPSDLNRRALAILAGLKFGWFREVVIYKDFAPYGCRRDASAPRAVARSVYR